MGEGMLNVKYSLNDYSNCEHLKNKRKIIYYKQKRSKVTKGNLKLHANKLNIGK